MGRKFKFGDKVSEWAMQRVFIKYSGRLLANDMDCYVLGKLGIVYTARSSELKPGWNKFAGKPKKRDTFKHSPLCAAVNKKTCSCR